MFDEDWVVDGLYGGELIRRAESSICNAGLTTRLTIDVLTAVRADPRLVQTLKISALVADIGASRFGKEWDEERHAIAVNDAESVADSYLDICDQLRRNYIVAVVASLEDFVKSLMVEFPQKSSGTDTRKLVGRPSDPDAAWATADNEYRRSIKSKRSASAAWVHLCATSGIPEASKDRVVAWGKNAEADEINTLVLLRNSFVHKSGVVGPAITSRLKQDIGEQISVGDKEIARFSRAIHGFLVAVVETL